VVGKSKRTWFTVERFFEENPLFVPERVSVLRSWLRQKTTNGIMIFDLIQGRVYAPWTPDGSQCPYETRDLLPEIRFVPGTWTRSVGTKNLGAKHQNNGLLSLLRTWTRSIGKMNHSACLDPKSPLERGGPLAVGSVLFEMPLTSFFAFLFCHPVVVLYGISP